MRREISEGHAVANHTWDHKELPRLSGEAVRNELTSASDAIERVTGVRPSCFRPPYGAYSEDVRRHLVSKGNELWMWSIDPHDYLLVNNAESVAQRVITNLGNHAGGTVLLHDTHPWSVAAMAKIIRWLDRENSDREQSGRAPYVVLDPARYLEGARARLPQIQAADALVNSSNRGRSRDAGADAGPAVEPTTGVVGEGPVDAGAVTAAMDASDGR